MRDPLHEVFLAGCPDAVGCALLRLMRLRASVDYRRGMRVERGLRLRKRRANNQPSMPLLVGAAGLANALPVELLYARPAAAAGAGGGRFDERSHATSEDNALCRGRGGRYGCRVRMVPG